MNQILFDFSLKFTKLSLGIFDWPTILIGREIYHPLFGEKRDALVKKLEGSGVQLISWRPHFTLDNEINPWRSVINSKGEIVAKIRDKNTIKIFKCSGESRTACEVPREENASRWYVGAMDIDAEDNIHVITAFRERDDQILSFKLFVFDENGNKKLQTPLPFLRSLDDPKVRIAIHKDGRIAISVNYAGGENPVYWERMF